MTAWPGAASAGKQQLGQGPLNRRHLSSLQHIPYDSTFAVFFLWRSFNLRSQCVVKVVVW